MNEVSTNSVERLSDAREQVEELREKMVRAKEDYTEARDMFDALTTVAIYRSLKEDLSFWTDETRRLGIIAWNETGEDSLVSGVQVQHSREMVIDREELLLEWAKENLPKAVITNLDFGMIEKYAQLVEEEPPGTHFAKTHKVIIRKYPKIKEDE